MPIESLRTRVLLLRGLHISYNDAWFNTRLRIGNKQRALKRIIVFDSVKMKASDAAFSAARSHFSFAQFQLLALGRVARVVALAAIAVYRVLRGERRRIGVSSRASVGREYSLCKPSAIGDINYRFRLSGAFDFSAQAQFFLFAPRLRRMALFIYSLARRLANASRCKRCFTINANQYQPQFAC